MSAFIVEDQIINRVVSFLSTDRESDHIRRLIVAETSLDIARIEDHCSTLGNAMFALNVNAIEQRYGAGEAKEFRALDFAYRYELAKRIQAYKSLQCWLYQCSEGDVPDTSLLYATMERVAGLLAAKIVCDLPAYDKATW